MEKCSDSKLQLVCTERKLTLLYMITNQLMEEEEVRSD